MEDPIAYLHELVGAVILEWGYFDHLVISQIWDAKAHNKPKPFYDIDYDARFNWRWKEWRSLHLNHCGPEKAVQALGEEVSALAAQRHDLAHNVHSIDLSPDGFSATLWAIRSRHDLESRFQKWLREFPTLPISQRKPHPTIEHIHYSAEDLRGLHRRIWKATDTLIAIGAARKAGTRYEIR